MRNIDRDCPLLTTSPWSHKPRLAVGLLAGLLTATLTVTSVGDGQAVYAAAEPASKPSAPAVRLGFQPDRDFFAVPESALVRPLGDIAANLGTPFPVPHAGTPGLGIPLGGMGAGSFMINQSGTFGPWSFNGSQGKSWEMRALPQAAFAAAHRHKYPFLANWGAKRTRDFDLSADD